MEMFLEETIDPKSGEILQSSLEIHSSERISNSRSNDTVEKFLFS